MLISMQLHSQEYIMPGYIVDMTSCDFDLDGDYDMLISCSYIDTIVIMSNDGTGNFDLQYFNRLNGDILCGDINKDSLPDIITRHGYGIDYLENLGYLEIGSSISISDITGTYKLCHLVDMDNDSLKDVVISHTSDEYWSVLKNYGNLSFQNHIIQSGSSVPYISTGNCNNDSLPDIGISYSNFNKTSILINQGNLSFNQIDIVDHFSSYYPIVRLDNIEHDDLALVGWYSSVISLYKNIGNQEFTHMSDYTISGSNAISELISFDINNDSLFDFVYTTWSSGDDSIYILQNSGEWSLFLSDQHYVGQMNWFKMRFADFNNDTYPDIYMTGYENNVKLKILWNNGDGTFSYSNPVGIREKKLVNYEINVFPNPIKTNSRIFINVCTTGYYSLLLSDLSGRLLDYIINDQYFQKGNHSIIWPDNQLCEIDLVPGMYILTLAGSKYFSSVKVLIYR